MTILYLSMSRQLQQKVLDLVLLEHQDLPEIPATLSLSYHRIALSSRDAN